MFDPRQKELAYKLVNYSCKIKKGEHCLVEMFGVDTVFVSMLVEEIYNAGGVPHVWLREPAVQRALITNASAEQLDEEALHDAALMDKMDAYIGIRAGNNSSEMSDVPQSQMELYTTRYSAKVHGKIRVPKTKWVILRYPTPAMAQLAKCSTEAFEDFYFNVCNLDYGNMSRAMDSLKALMEKTDKVRITGPNTDLTFSIKGMNAVKCDGGRNIPDGEVYTAPVRNSVNGRLTYNTPSMQQGYVFENISFVFKDGKIVEATANNTPLLNKILDTDEGARYIGEFSFGINPYINKPMLDTLFDEKIAGSIHFTPGKAYDTAFNGNVSAIHWDLVYIQTPQYGGGEIYFDDVLIREDGRFVLPELDCCNPENLK